eukprot:410096-Rhodomonas_salina.1
MHTRYRGRVPGTPVEDPGWNSCPGKGDPATNSPRSRTPGLPGYCDAIPGGVHEQHDQCTFARPDLASVRKRLAVPSHCASTGSRVPRPVPGYWYPGTNRKSDDLHLQG